jgi:hypothetical protein
MAPIANLGGARGLAPPRRLVRPFSGASDVVPARLELLLTGQRGAFDSVARRQLGSALAQPPPGRPAGPLATAPPAKQAKQAPRAAEGPTHAHSWHIARPAGAPLAPPARPRPPAIARTSWHFGQCPSSNPCPRSLPEPVTSGGARWCTLSLHKRANERLHPGKGQKKRSPARSCGWQGPSPSEALIAGVGGGSRRRTDSAVGGDRRHKSNRNARKSGASAAATGTLPQCAPNCLRLPGAARDKAMMGPTRPDRRCPPLRDPGGHSPDAEGAEGASNGQGRSHRTQPPRGGAPRWGCRVAPVPAWRACRKAVCTQRSARRRRREGVWAGGRGDGCRGQPFE